MILGTNVFKCDNCGKIFRGLDIEWMASAFSVPQKCPRCGSMHTKPLLQPKSLYKEIWKRYDINQTED